MDYVWEDLPKPLNCFTVTNTTMVNLDNGKVIRHYSTNTKIVVVQKCVTPECTYYRTADAYFNKLNYAFKADAFGLPNEKAPSAHSSRSNSLSNSTLSSKPATRTQTPEEKQTSIQKVILPNDGEGGRRGSWLRRIFRRIHGKAKNS